MLVVAVDAVVVVVVVAVAAAVVAAAVVAVAGRGAQHQGTGLFGSDPPREPIFCQEWDRQGSRTENHGGGHNTTAPRLFGSEPP